MATPTDPPGDKPAGSNPAGDRPDRYASTSHPPSHRPSAAEAAGREPVGVSGIYPGRESQPIPTASPVRTYQARTEEIPPSPTAPPAPPAPDRPDADRSLRDEAKARLGRARELIGELADYARLYVRTRLDLAAESVRKLVLLAALGVVAAVVGATALVVATAQLLTGVADALGLLFGHRSWLGAIVTGLLVLGAAALAAYLLVNRLTDRSKTSARQKYDAMHAQQRRQYGHDVHDVARNAGQKAHSNGSAKGNPA